MRMPGNGIEHAQVVVNFGDGGDGAARIRRTVHLLDGDGGGESLNEVHVGLLKLIEKLPCIGREALHIPPLPFRIESVKSQR